MANEPQDRLRKIVDGMRAGAAEEVRRQVGEVIPKGLSAYMANPESEDEEDEEDEGYEYEEGEEHDHEDEEDEDEYEDEYEDEDEGVYSLTFENPREHKENLAMAVAAWRMLSENDDDIVAMHKNTGIAFFGRPDDFQEYCDQRDLNYNSWDKYTDYHVLKGMDCNLEAFKQVLSDMEEDDPSMEAAREAFEKFHWGDKAKVTGLVDIPGLSPEAKPYFLGVGREICYGAKKDGNFEEYYHIFGEESGTFPAVYGLGERCIIIYGGNTRVSPRGIVD